MMEPTTPFDDPLEQELSDLRPVALPNGVRRGVAGALASRRTRRSSLVLRFVAAGLAAAACVAIVAMIARESRGPQLTITGGGLATLPAAAESPPPAPTLGELRLALARSPEAAEALLNGGGGGAPARSPRAFGPVASSASPTDPKF
jgi:hypothetical protein